MPNPNGNTKTLKQYRPKWNTGSTQTIRIPIALVDQVLEYAHQLDNGMGTEDPKQIQTSLNHLSQVIDTLKKVLDTPRNNFSREKKQLLQAAIDQLEGMNT